MDLKDLQGKFKGKRLFIIGNGPSLSVDDLNQVKGHYSLAMNRIGLIFPETDWRPTFYLCVTENIKLSDWRRTIMLGFEDAKYGFYWDELKDSIGREFLADLYAIKCYNKSPGEDLSDDSLWSNSLDKGFNKFGSSILVAFQLSNYLGFSEIILLGTDLNFRNNLFQRILYRLRLPNFMQDKNHFASGYGTPGLDSKSLNKNMLLAHMIVVNHLRNSGVNIINASKGGKLELYRRMELDTVLNDEVNI